MTDESLKQIHAMLDQFIAKQTAESPSEATPVAPPKRLSEMSPEERNQLGPLGIFQKHKAEKRAAGVGNPWRNMAEELSEKPRDAPVPSEPAALPPYQNLRLRDMPPEVIRTMSMREIKARHEAERVAQGQGNPWALARRLMTGGR